MRTLCFAAIVSVAAALANNKPVHGARHKALLVESPAASGRPLLLNVDGVPTWGRCAEGQLALPLKPLKAEHCLQANLVYIRIPKTGSTSLSSVLKRIGARAGASGVEIARHAELPEPSVSSFHETYRKMQDFIHSKAKPIVKVTMVREPVARYLSVFSYRLTKFEDLKNMTVLDFFQSRDKAGHDSIQYNFLRRDEAQEDIESILNEYSLVGVTERFEESVVLLMEMLGLSYCDVMYSDGKVSGEAVQFGKHGKPLRASTPLTEQPQEVQDYVASKEYQGYIANDLKLYAAANERLDMLIDRVGRSNFEAKVTDFKKWRNGVLNMCKDELKIQGDASEWFDRNCYVNDVGCGYKCFDRLCKAHGEVIDYATRTKSKEHDQVPRTKIKEHDRGPAEPPGRAIREEAVVQPFDGDDAP